MDANEVLGHNRKCTRFPALTAEAQLSSTLASGQHFSAKSRTLSRFEELPGNQWKSHVMSRVTDGQPSNARFLIEQRSDQTRPPTWVRSPGGHALPLTLQPWDPIPLSALRWMDYILPPPGTFTATLNPTASPSDPGWAPPAACLVVDLALASSFWTPEPKVTRLWIDQRDTFAVDYRIEHHLSDGTVRVIVSTQWTPLVPGGPAGPAQRVVDDPVSGRTIINVTKAAPTADPHLFNQTEMANGNW